MSKSLNFCWDNTRQAEVALSFFCGFRWKQLPDLVIVPEGIGAVETAP